MDSDPIMYWVSILKNEREIFWANVGRSVIGDGFVSTQTYDRIVGDSA